MLINKIKYALPFLFKSQKHQNRVEKWCGDFDAVSRLEDSAALQYQDFVELPDQLTEKICRVRHAISRAATAEQYFSIAIHEETNMIVSSGLIEAAMSKYFSCFQKGTNSPNLDYRAVFSEQKVLQDGHLEIRDLRDHAINHPSTDFVNILTFGALNSAGEIQDTPSFVTTFSILKKEKVLLFNELLFGLKTYLDQRIVREMQRLEIKASELDVKNLPRLSIEDLADKHMASFATHPSSTRL